jgi:hypothetical protein
VNVKSKFGQFLKIKEKIETGLRATSQPAQFPFNHCRPSRASSCPPFCRSPPLTMLTTRWRAPSWSPPPHVGWHSLSLRTSDWSRPWSPFRSSRTPLLCFCSCVRSPFCLPSPATPRSPVAANTKQEHNLDVLYRCCRCELELSATMLGASIPLAAASSSMSSSMIDTLCPPPAQPTVSQAPLSSTATS